MWRAVVTPSGIPSSTARSAAIDASRTRLTSCPAATKRSIHAGSTRYGYSGKSNWMYRAPAVDRVRHQRALDLDRVGDELLERGIATGLGADHRRQRMSEDRRSRERHLERVPLGDVGHERCLARARRVDRGQTTHDLVDVQPYVLAAVVVERDGLAGPHAVDRVVERVHEHPSPELAVGDDVEAAVDLPLHGRTDRVVLDPCQLRPIAVALFGERGRMPRLVERVDRGAQPRRTQE